MGDVCQMSENKRYNPAQAHAGALTPYPSLSKYPNISITITTAMSNVNMPASAKYTPNTSTLLL